MTTEEHLEKLEKHLAAMNVGRQRDRCWFSVTLILFCGWLMWMQWSEGRSKVIRAKAFHVVDEDGNICASLSGHQGTSGLLLKGGNGKAHAALSVSVDGGSLLFLDGESSVTTLGARKDGGAQLLLSNRNTKASAALGANEVGGVGLALFTTDKTDDAKDSTHSASLSAGPEWSEMSLYNRNGQARISSGTSKEKGPTVVLSDETGRAIRSMP